MKLIFFKFYKLFHLQTKGRECSSVGRVNLPGMHVVLGSTSSTTGTGHGSMPGVGSEILLLFWLYTA